MADTGRPRADDAGGQATSWVPYFTAHGDPFVVPADRPYLTSQIAAVSTAPDDYGRANAVLLAAAPTMLALLKKVGTRCAYFGHDRDKPHTDRRRRVDCADDQCQNSEHVSYVECTATAHDIADLLALIEAPAPSHDDASNTVRS